MLHFVQHDIDCHPERSEGSGVRLLRSDALPAYRSQRRLLFYMTLKTEIQKLFPKRKANTHKGDYGKVFILAGSRGLSGACILSAQAAMRSGAGLVTVGVPESLGLVMARRLTEAMWKTLPETKEGTIAFSAFSQISQFLKSQDVFAIGPGLSRNSSTQQLIRNLILSSAKPIVIDADALNAFQGRAHLFLKTKAPAILTPHPVEFVRLFGGNVPRTKTERIHRAKEAAKKFKVTLVLKGNESVIASSDGQVFINSTGNPGMATGGTGDVLTGMIAALLGQGLKPFDAARAGVYIHGLAGDLAVKKIGEVSLIASDLIEHLRAAFRSVIGR